MWVCLNNAFFSIVDDGRSDGKLLVRARRKGDIEKIFPDAAGSVQRLVGRDYLWRTYMDLYLVADVIAEQVSLISYGNFKDSVKDKTLATAYGKFWHIHSDLQELPPYSIGYSRGRLL